MTMCILLCAVQDSGIAHLGRNEHSVNGGVESWHTLGKQSCTSRSLGGWTRGKGKLSPVEAVLCRSYAAD